MAPISKYEKLRQLSAAIVSGNIKACELQNATPYSLWTVEHNERLFYNEPLSERHGGERHRLMMHLIKKYFEEEDFEVTHEPHLNYGRADLGVYKEGFRDPYVEVGTISLCKHGSTFCTGDMYVDANHKHKLWHIICITLSPIWTNFYFFPVRQLF